MTISTELEKIVSGVNNTFNCIMPIRDVHKLICRLAASALINVNQPKGEHECPSFTFTKCYEQLRDLSYMKSLFDDSDFQLSYEKISKSFRLALVLELHVLFDGFNKFAQFHIHEESSRFFDQHKVVNSVRIYPNRGDGSHTIPEHLKNEYFAICEKEEKYNKTIDFKRDELEKVWKEQKSKLFQNWTRSPDQITIAEINSILNSSFKLLNSIPTEYAVSHSEVYKFLVQFHNEERGNAPRNS